MNKEFDDIFSNTPFPIVSAKYSHRHYLKINWNGEEKLKFSPVIYLSINLSINQSIYNICDICSDMRLSSSYSAGNILEQ